MVDNLIQCFVIYKLCMFKEEFNMLCNHCGAENQQDAKFCAGCGADLTEQSQVQAQQMYNQPDYQQQQMYNQPDYQQPSYQQPMYQPAETGDPGRGFAIASLILGIVSFLCLPAITGVLGIIFGIVAKNKGSKSPMAIAGIICGAIGIVLWIVMLIFGMTLSFTDILG